MTALSPCAQIVRRHDPDRFFCTLFAPPEHRETLFTLYAFNHELARAREAVREPMAALIRLQWWREVIEGKRPRHEVAIPLGEALDAQRLDAALLAEMIDAREAETEPVPNLPAFEAYVLGTAGALMVAAARALGMPDAERLRRPGASYGVAGVLRSIDALTRQTRSVLPADGTPPESLKTLARSWLIERAKPPRPALAAALPLVLARRRLRRAGTPLGDRLALLAAAATGRP